jgi:hypothetical protein
VATARKRKPGAARRSRIERLGGPAGPVGSPALVGRLLRTALGLRRFALAPVERLVHTLGSLAGLGGAAEPRVPGRRQPAPSPFFQRPARCARQAHSARRPTARVRTTV